MKGQRLDGKGVSTFHSDLKEAHQVENTLGKRLVNLYGGDYNTSQSFGSFPDWDVSYTSGSGVEITFEVKQDKKAYSTGNVAIEFQRILKDGTVKPTCLSISKTDCYAYFISGVIYLISTNVLREKIKKSTTKKIVHGAGEGNKVSIFLIPVKEFKSWCTEKIKLDK